MPKAFMTTINKTVTFMPIQKFFMGSIHALVACNAMTVKSRGANSRADKRRSRSGSFARTFQAVMATMAIVVRVEWYLSLIMATSVALHSVTF